jgi:serine-type D-Ala-D-Ala carboxypeptidase/endopeptidase
MPGTRLSLLVLSLGALSAPAAAQRALPSDSAVRAILRERVESGRHVGIAVGLLEPTGTRTLAHGRGAAGARLDDHSLFEIGSITKTFTSVILADMVSKGTVRLDQPVAELLPPGTVVPSRGGKQITLADLASHISGLPRMPSNFAPKDPANPYADYDGARMLAFLASHQLQHDIGTRYEYSNIGAGLLGFALANKAGMSYEALVTERLLRPLGMSETAITLTPAMRARLAPGHNPGGQPVANWELDALAGAGALRSSVHDRSRFQIGARTAVGLAWHRIISPSGDTVLAHDGGTAGYVTFAAFDPKRRVGVVVLSNSSSPIQDIGLHLLDERAPLTRPAAQRKEITLSADALQRFVGEYPLAPTFVITISRVGDNLFAQATGQPRFPLFAETPTTFFFKVVDAQLEFETDSTGNATAVVLVQNGARQRAVKR